MATVIVVENNEILLIKYKGPDEFPPLIGSLLSLSFLCLRPRFSLP